jgi:hypothetical protein
VQGRLRDEELVVTIKTECMHCTRSLQLEVDSQLRFQGVSDGAEPMVFEPAIDWAKFKKPNIIHDY